MSLNILLVDDHTLFREGLEGLLSRRDINIVAAVGSGQEGLRLAIELDHAAHHAVIGQRERVHPALCCTLEERADPARRVEDAVLGVHV